MLVAYAAGASSVVELASAFAFAVPAVDAETGIGHVAGALVGCEVAAVADAWADSAGAVGADQVQCTAEN